MQTCGWTGKLEDLDKHRKTCPFQQVRCPHKNCIKTMQRREMEEHDNVCVFKMVKCEACKKKDLIRFELEKHIKDDCPETEIRCPKNCTSAQGEITKIKRFNLNDHLTNCARVLVDCPFKDQRCLVQVERQHLDKHVQENMVTHMMLIGKQNSYNKEKCSSLAMQYWTHDGEIAQLKEEIYKVKPNEGMKIFKIGKKQPKEEITQSKIENTQLKEEMKNVEIENTQLKEEMKIKNEQLKEEMKEFMIENAQLKEEMKEVKIEITQLKEEMKEVKTENTQLKEELNKVEIENTQLKGEMKKVKESVGTYVWTIDDFPSLTKKYPNGSKFRSPTFCLCGNSWYMWLYPNGNDTESTGFLSIFLWSNVNNEDDSQTSDDVPIVDNSKTCVSFRLSMISQDPGTEDDFLEIPTHVYSKTEDQGWGSSKFKNTTDALSTAYCNSTDGSLTIQCTIQLVKPQ